MAGAKRKRRCPSLIGTTHGSSRQEMAQRVVTCKRCLSKVTSQMNYMSVSKPGRMGRTPYCLLCYKEILIKTKEDLMRLESVVDQLFQVMERR